MGGTKVRPQPFSFEFFSSPVAVVIDAEYLVQQWIFFANSLPAVYLLLW